MASPYKFEFSRQRFGASISKQPVAPGFFGEAVVYVDVADLAAIADGTEITSVTDRAGNAVTKGAAGQGKSYGTNCFGGQPGIDSSSQWLKIVGTGQPAVQPFNGQPWNTNWTMLDVALVRSSQLNY